MTALPSKKRAIESRTVAGYAQNKMSRNSASTIATGGAGYTFADKVAAAFLVQMLQRGFPFESELGRRK